MQKCQKCDFPEDKLNSSSDDLMTKKVIKSLKNGLKHAYYWARDPKVCVAYITNV